MIILTGISAQAHHTNRNVMNEYGDILAQLCQEWSSPESLVNHLHEDYHNHPFVKVIDILNSDVYTEEEKEIIEQELEANGYNCKDD